MLRGVTQDTERELDPQEIDEWRESLDDVLHRYGPVKVRELLTVLQEQAYRQGIKMPFTANTPYINTIPVSEQPRFPGNRDIERRIKSIVRWNALAMVVRGNKECPGIGGHLSTYASAATLLEVGFNHFFRGKDDPCGGDIIYFQGHASPGVYSRAFLEGRLNETNLKNFRRELQPGGGLSSYPHPWLMPTFWEFPTVSMGLGPINAIYHARFIRYLEDRGLKNNRGSHVWAFVGDGEVDEPETLGAINLASREGLDNLIFVINCNLQRLDGPVRGNGKIIQELEAVFRGAGWNVIKCIWGGDWDPLLEADKEGFLCKRMGEVVDGWYQKYKAKGGAFIREHFFGAYPESAKLCEHLTDDQILRLKRGGHDPEKVYAAYKAATDFTGGPTVILAKTIKGYGLGEIGEGRNATHSAKKLSDEALREFRTRFGIPISDEDLPKVPFYVPPKDGPEMQYVRERRQSLGGPVPDRRPGTPFDEVPPLSDFQKFLSGSSGKEVSTTKGFVDLFSSLLRDKRIGKYIVPIIPDEARTFGMEGLFRQCGIYAHSGQLYEPVDSDTVLYYKEAKDGQILEEGINECGSMASFVAAGTAYSVHGINTIPFYIYYSMFGFQRIGDQVWLAADSRCRGFMLGGTAGRTTLNGEGLQHEDGHSHVLAATVPNLVAYDPAYAYETAVIIQDGLRRMYKDQEPIFYYLTLYNDDYAMPAMPEGSHDGILKGLYKFQSFEGKDVKGSRPQIFGSGPILPHALAAGKLLAEKYGIPSDVWSATSYKELRREALETERWNLLHPTETPRSNYVQNVLQGQKGPFIAASDYMRMVPEQIAQWVPGKLISLGTDGFGRSESREALRRHFQVDAPHIAFAVLSGLYQEKRISAEVIRNAVKDLNINTEGVDPVRA